MAVLSNSGSSKTANSRRTGGILRHCPRWLAVGLWLWSGLVWAQEEPKRWSVSPMVGVHSPKLTLLNEGEFKAPLPGRGRLVFEDTGDNVNFEFVIENSLPTIDYGTEAGVEFGLLLSDRDALVFGASVWEGVSTATVQTEIPFQGTLTPVGYERSGRISYFQYFLGWRRILLNKPGKFNLYGRLTLHEVFDVDYKEDLVFGFQGEAGQPFKRFIVMESQATGLFMGQIGLGGEYFLRDWFSLGLDVGYTISARKFRLGNATLKTDVQPEDNLNFKTPVQIDQQGELRYLAEATSFADEDVTYRDLKLGFDGWRALFRINMYF